MVRLNGRPLRGVMVLFLPLEEGQGRPASGFTDEDGAFELGTKNPGDGASPGTYTVTLGEGPPQPGTAAVPSEAPPRIPERYTDPKTTPLRVTIAPEKK